MLTVRRAKAWMRPFTEAWCPAMASARFFERMPRKLRKTLQAMDARQLQAMAFLLEFPELFDPDEFQAAPVPAPCRIPRHRRPRVALAAGVRDEVSAPAPLPACEPWDALLVDEDARLPRPAEARPTPLWTLLASRLALQPRP